MGLAEAAFAFFSFSPSITFLIICRVSRRETCLMSDLLTAGNNAATSSKISHDQEKGKRDRTFVTSILDHTIC